MNCRYQAENTVSVISNKTKNILEKFSTYHISKENKIRLPE
jgi:hypothetical protein